MGIDQISFLPADVSSHAFNRQMAWEEPKQHEILYLKKNWRNYPRLLSVYKTTRPILTIGLLRNRRKKYSRYLHYYAAFYGLNPFPFKKCNAPWVSTVIEADGSVRPCFFHDTIGNIRDSSLATILNSDKAIRFRKGLDMSKDPTCVKCVCSLNLSPFAKLN